MTRIIKPLQHRPRLLPLLVLLCSCIATLFVWHSLRQSQQAAAELHFQQLSVEVFEAIEKRMGNHQQILLGGTGLCLVLLDIDLPDGNGLELIEEIHRLYPGLPVVVLSAAELSTEQLNRVEAALAKSRTDTQHFLDVLARLLPTKESHHA